MEVPPGDILKVAVSTLSAKAKLFNNSMFNQNGNVAQDQDDGDDDMDDDDDKMPSQGQIVDLPAIHSQMTDAEIKKNILKKSTCRRCPSLGQNVLCLRSFTSTMAFKSHHFQPKGWQAPYFVVKHYQ